MTERKRWPNEAENARVESIVAAREGLQAARELARRPEVQGARLAEIVDQFHKIIESLMMVGPQTA